jgi:hypothetical protein
MKKILCILILIGLFIFMANECDVPEVQTINKINENIPIKEIKIRADVLTIEDDSMIVNDTIYVFEYEGNKFMYIIGTDRASLIQIMENKK